MAAQIIVLISLLLSRPPMRLPNADGPGPAPARLPSHIIHPALMPLPAQFIAASRKPATPPATNPSIKNAK
jgi:hypothetical protein